MKTTLTVILIILALLFLQRECSRPDVIKPEPDTLRTTRKEYDSTLITKELPKVNPKESIKPTYSKDTVFLAGDTIYYAIPVDSLAIFLAYMSKNIYDRILMDDTTALIRIIDTVHQNQLWGSKLEYKNRQPVTIHETVIIHPPDDPRFQLYVGGFVTGSQDYFGSGPAIFAKTKRDHLYGAGYDVVNKTAQLHMQWKISLRK